MKKKYKRRIARLVLVVLFALFVVYTQQSSTADTDVATGGTKVTPETEKLYGELARTVLDRLAVKGRAPKTEYRRSQFGDGWVKDGVCDTRNIILKRDLKKTVVTDRCKVMSGVLTGPYTNERIDFVRGFDTSDDVQIDHVVALSDAWQKGAQGLSMKRRVEFANDPLNLLAVKGEANQDKSASDAASWLPPNKAFRCQYVARQIAVKARYDLWVARAEKQAMVRILSFCPDERVLK